VQKTQEIQKDWAERKARRESAKYLAALQRMPDVRLEKFLSCAKAFRDHLEQQGIRLTVVLWPENTALLEKPGVPQLHPSPVGAVLFQAAKALRHEHVKVIETLPQTHEFLCLHPEAALLQPDKHLGWSLIDQLTAQIYSNLDPRLIMRNGRGFLTAGDCYAYHLGMAMRKHPDLSETHIFWRNNGAHLVPYEIASLKEPGLHGIHQLIWVIRSQSLLNSQEPGTFPPLAASLAQRMPEVPGQRTIKAMLKELPMIPETLGKDSPYPDVLVQCRFHAESGEEFLALAHVMQKHKVNANVKIWTANLPMVVTLVPWKSAIQASPELAHEQILDTTPDFTLPRYFVTSWLHAP
jgi:hypothetical protein